MDAMQAIFGRRSIRKYTSQNVSEEMIEELLKAGMAAPSANNEQPWHFVIIRDRNILDEIPKFHPYSKMLHEAPVAILVCGDEKRCERYWVQDCSAATENILIAIAAKGLGGVWLGIYPREERIMDMRELLGLPKEVTPLSLIALGYPAERKGPADRFDPARVHHDRW